MASATAGVLDARRTERRGQVYVALAAIAWSSAGVLQHGVEVGAAAQVGVRALFACVALCRMAVQYAEIGTQVEVGKLDGHQKRIPATVVRFPFYDPEKQRPRS